MESAKHHTGYRGGRPKKVIKQNCLLGVKCSILEKAVISQKAAKANLSVSAYLRTLGINGQVDIKIKGLPKEVLELKSILNHAAANLNQIAKKRNSNDELNIMERTVLQSLAELLQKIALDLKTYLQ